MGSRPVVEGWFSEGEEPALTGSRCTQCGTFAFPKQLAFCSNPHCDCDEIEEASLSRRGTIWSYTNSMYKPPHPYVAGDDFKPYALAAVELEHEKMVIVGQVAAGVAYESLAVGDEVELVIERLFSDDDGDVVTWKWRPVAEGASS